MSDEPSAALRAFTDLVTSDGWRPLPGPPAAVIHLHPWPDGSVDTLVLLGETEALIERTNPVGQPVWRANDTLIKVIAAYRDVPAPFAPDAPRAPLADPRDAERDLGTP